MQQQKQTYTIKTFDIGPMQNLIYVITDNDTKESAIVDPAWDMTEIYEYLNNNNLILKKILLTHSHNDHVNAVDKVLDKFDTQIHINKKEKVFWAKDYDNFSINYGGDIIYLGETQIKSLHTPGHTPGSTCYYIGNNLIAGDASVIGEMTEARRKEKVKINYESLEVVKAYDDWGSEDMTAVDKAITDGKTFVG